ncbi:hypothetical protein BACCIP111899_02614 [Bacillus rhizoplanae]|uniref:YHYH domain-containing protein n=1 Tax=Bacillus rhizoplanae TaxID=2880966 RepID=A0ABN8A1G2_9BACI|nr:hypothetical protein [Bacillus rhizoplanae]CAG9613399.1 hypothetical protein BACCIP111899_02614 [Bacillus rhizoplanae]
MLKNIVYIFFFYFFLIPQITLAHLGRTDSSRGHYCWTNCENWDLKNGQYHIHNGGNDNASDNNEPEYDPQAEYDSGYQKGYETAYKYASNCQEYEWEWNGTQDYGNGFEDGIDQGHSGGSK